MGFPKLFPKEATSFLTRGLGTLRECNVCKVKEALNGFYELYMEYPINGAKSQFIDEELIVYASTPRGEQPFRIYNIDKDLENIKIYANHIFYDLKDNFIEDTNVVNKSGAGALSQILSATQYPHNFVSLSDNSKIASSRLVRKDVLEALLNSNMDNSYISRWGGELQRDIFNINFNISYGTNRGVVIKYSKNMMGINVNTNTREVCTRIMPMGYNGLLLPEKYIDSPKIGNYLKPKIRIYEFPDIIAQDAEIEIAGAITLEEAYQTLRNRCASLFADDKIDEPPTICKVQMLALQDTEEFKNKAILERVYPFDIVTIKHLNLGINIQVKMTYYEWDSLLNRYISMDFGNEKNSIVTTINNNTGVKEEIKNDLDMLEDTVLKKAQNNATNLINTGFGGYVVKTREEILIMDTEDVMTAQSVWRWNKNGLGYSSTGYNGAFNLAMTSNGEIIADFIKGGYVDAQLIKTGILSSKEGNVYINMESGEFNFNNVFKFQNNELIIDFQNYATKNELNSIVGADSTIIKSIQDLTSGQTDIKNENKSLSDKINLLNSDGINKLRNTMVSINEDGLNVGKSTDIFSSILDDTGLYLYSLGIPIARYSNLGSEIKELVVTGRAQIGGLRIEKVIANGEPRCHIHFM